MAVTVLATGLSVPAIGQTFHAAQTYAIPANPAHVIAADFTGDGRLDVAVACRVLSATQGQVGILVQNVGGTLNAVSTRTWPLARRPEHLNAMHVNFLGPIDLVVADGSGPLVALHANGTGAIDGWTENEDLTLFYQVGEGANQSTGFTINTIANALVATGVGSNGRLHARVGDGDGTYEGFFQSPTIELGNGAFPMARGRLDSGPLEDDLVVCITTSNIVKVFMYKSFVMCSDICWRGYAYDGACPLGPGEVAPPDVVVGNNPIGAVLDHFNPAADNNTDMAVLCSGDNTVRVFRGNGNGTFTAVQTISVGSPVKAIASGDLNRDNRADLVVAVDPAAGNGSVRVYVNNGSGTFTLGPVLTVAVDPTSVTVADVSGDGLRDVVATSQNAANGNLVVFRNSSPPACLADFDGVGGVQVNDISRSIMRGSRVSRRGPEPERQQRRAGHLPVSDAVFAGARKLRRDRTRTSRIAPERTPPRLYCSKFVPTTRPARRTQARSKGSAQSHRGGRHLQTPDRLTRRRGAATYPKAIPKGTHHAQRSSIHAQYSADRSRCATRRPVRAFAGTAAGTHPAPSAAVVPRLGPRVREIGVDHPRARIRHAPPQKLERIGVQHPHVGQIARRLNPPPDAVRGVQIELPRVLDPQVVGLGPQRALLQEKRPLPRPDLDLQRALRVREPRAEIDVPRAAIGPEDIGKRRQIAARADAHPDAGIIEFAAAAESERHGRLYAAARGSRGCATRRSPASRRGRIRGWVLTPLPMVR